MSLNEFAYLNQNPLSLVKSVAVLNSQFLLIKYRRFLNVLRWNSKMNFSEARYKKYLLLLLDMLLSLINDGANMIICKGIKDGFSLPSALYQLTLF